MPDAANCCACIATAGNLGNMTSGLSFPFPQSLPIFAKKKRMDILTGTVALQRAEMVTKAGGTFSISFFPFSRKKRSEGNVALKTYENCTMRLPLPHEKWDIDGKNYFLFLTEDGQPKSCYRALIRYMSFSNDGNTIKKIQWYEQDRV